MPSSASRTTASGSLMSFFIPCLHSVAGAPRRGTVLPSEGAGQSARGGGAAVDRVGRRVDVRREAVRGLPRKRGLVGLERAVDEQHVVGRGRRRRLGGKALALPEVPDPVHGLLAQRLVGR